MLVFLYNFIKKIKWFDFIKRELQFFNRRSRVLWNRGLVNRSPLYLTPRRSLTVAKSLRTRTRFTARQSFPPGTYACTGAGRSGHAGLSRALQDRSRSRTSSMQTRTNLNSDASESRRRLKQNRQLRVMCGVLNTILASHFTSSEHGKARHGNI
jgi:hypothetical protein